MDNFRITVATITLNDLAGLRRTVDSVLSQDYELYEFIVVDGGSTDGTEEYIRSLSTDTLKWVSEPDDGISDAFNKSLLLASGDLLIFLNAGDVFVDKTTLSAAMNAIPAECSVKASIFYGDYYQVIDAEALRMRCDHHELLSTCSLNHQSTFIGAFVYKRFQFDTRLVVEMDYDYWLRCLRAGVPFFKLDLPISKFSLGGLSSGLTFSLHIYVIRFFLLSIQRRNRLKFGDIVHLFLGVCVLQSTTSLRKVLGRGLIRNAKNVLRKLGLKKRPILETPSD